MKRSIPVDRGSRASARQRCALATLGLISTMLVPEELSAADIGHAEVTLEAPAGGAYPLEMLKLHVRSTVRGLVAVDTLRQPSLPELDWKQLAPDTWTSVVEKGVRVKKFERTLAIYPLRAGRITIPAFTHTLTLMDTSGLRPEKDLRTAEVTLDVRPLPETAGDWWLPAADLAVSDSWDKRPDRLRAGETARRTVVLEAKGVEPERLPPAPQMRAPGIISFAAPTERSTRLTAEGPVSRVVYRWDVRPVSAQSVVLPAVVIRWFDTVTRRERNAVIPESRIALASAGNGNEAARPSPEPPGFSPATFLLASFAGAIWGGAAFLLLWRRDRRHDGALEKLRRAAHRRDPQAFRRALSSLASAFSMADDSALSSELANLDRHLFGSEDAAAPALVPLYRRIRKRVRSPPARPTRDLVGSRLLPLDG